MPTTTTLIRLADVMRIVGFGKSQIYKLIGRGEFPLPVKLGRASRWSASEVAEWVQGRIATRSPGAWGPMSPNRIAPRREVLYTDGGTRG
ncbi:MAG TPA: AlpA family phage regulatory protein [Candidatus Tumulicola sp.]|nr:AlpA family phage regulatory protein [Candidatus Tumulicola sp.]